MLGIATLNRKWRIEAERAFTEPFLSPLEANCEPELLNAARIKLKPKSLDHLDSYEPTFIIVLTKLGLKLNLKVC